MPVETCTDPEEVGVGTGRSDPLWKITRGNRATGFLRNTGMDPPREAITLLAIPLWKITSGYTFPQEYWDRPIREAGGHPL